MCIPIISDTMTILPEMDRAAEIVSQLYVALHANIYSISPFLQTSGARIEIGSKQPPSSRPVVMMLAQKGAPISLPLINIGVSRLMADTLLFDRDCNTMVRRDMC